MTIYCASQKVRHFFEKFSFNFQPSFFVIQSIRKGFGWGSSPGPKQRLPRHISPSVKQVPDLVPLSTSTRHQGLALQSPEQPTPHKTSTFIRPTIKAVCKSSLKARKESCLRTLGKDSFHDSWNGSGRVKQHLPDAGTGTEAALWHFLCPVPTGTPRTSALTRTRGAPRGPRQPAPQRRLAPLTPTGAQRTGRHQAPSQKQAEGSEILMTNQPLKTDLRGPGEKKKTHHKLGQMLLENANYFIYSRLHSDVI